MEGPLAAVGLVYIAGWLRAPRMSTQPKQATAKVGSTETILHRGLETDVGQGVRTLGVTGASYETRGGC